MQGVMIMPERIDDDQVFSLLYSVCEMAGRDAGLIVNATKRIAELMDVEPMVIATDIRKALFVKMMRAYAETNLC
jgi:hypothetical protein